MMPKRLRATHLVNVIACSRTELTTELSCEERLEARLMGIVQKGRRRKSVITARVPLQGALPTKQKGLTGD